MDVEDFRAIRKVADEAGVAVHLDGARIFNASAAAGVDVAEYARRGRHPDVLRLEGARARRSGRSSAAPPSRSARAGGSRSCSAAPGGRRGSMAAAGLVALEEGPKRLARGPRARPPARRGRRRDRCRAASIRPTLKRTWSSPTRKPWRLTPLEVANRLEDHGRRRERGLGQGPHGHARRRRRRGLEIALIAWRRIGPSADADDGGGSPMKLFGPKVPGGDRQAHPARPAAGEDVAGAALRPDPGLRRVDVGPRGQRARREPLHADVRTS